MKDEQQIIDVEHVLVHKKMSRAPSLKLDAMSPLLPVTLDLSGWRQQSTGSTRQPVSSLKGAAADWWKAPTYGDDVIPPFCGATVTLSSYPIAKVN